MRRGGNLLGSTSPTSTWPGAGSTLRVTKTRWDRVVPMGERAAAWLVRYLSDARPHLVRDEAYPAVFLATNGERLGATWLTGQVHRYVQASGTGKAGSCHLFRHSAATLMLEGGADIRYVQELLGHRSLVSTHIYTRVAPERLAAVHAATHPGAALAPATATFLFSCLAALVSGRGAARWDNRDHYMAGPAKTMSKPWRARIV